MNQQLLTFLEDNRFVPAEIDLVDVIKTLLQKAETRTRSSPTGGLAFEELFRQLKSQGAIYGEPFVQNTLKKLAQTKDLAGKPLPVAIYACDEKWHWVTAMG